MFKFLKVFEKKPLRKFEVPAEKAEEIINLSQDNSRLGKYRLWKEIESLFPETSTGGWSLDLTNAVHLYVFEKAEK